MKITCLIENLVYKGGLLAEHGLSFHIDTGTHSVLFDTGQTGNFILNAAHLGVDISEVDAVAISHGHYDHTGGLARFLEINKKATVFLKKEALWQKFNGKKNIGFEYKQLSIENRFSFIEETTEIVPNIFLINDIPIINKDDTHWKYFLTQNNGNTLPDSFDDELFLAINSNETVSLFSSCSHRGISNIVLQLSKLFKKPLNMIAGGFHLKDTQPDAIHPIVETFNILKPQKIGVCHCTGLEHYERIKQHFPNETFYFHTGVIVYV